jgi:hypothetical protein
MLTITSLEEFLTKLPPEMLSIIVEYLQPKDFSSLRIAYPKLRLALDYNWLHPCIEKGDVFTAYRYHRSLCYGMFKVDNISHRNGRLYVNNRYKVCRDFHSGDIYVNDPTVTSLDDSCTRRVQWESKRQYDNELTSIATKFEEADKIENIKDKHRYHVKIAYSMKRWLDKYRIAYDEKSLIIVKLEEFINLYRLWFLFIE